MTPVWPTIERFLAEHGTAAAVTLAESAGSSLREIGTRVMVRLDGRFFSTEAHFDKIEPSRKRAPSPRKRGEVKGRVNFIGMRSSGHGVAHA